MTFFTQMIARLLLVPTLVIAAAVLVKGYTETGDGFSAGVIAAFGVVMQYVAFGYRDIEQFLPVRFAPFMAGAGLLLALGLVFMPVFGGEPIVTHIPRPNNRVIELGSLELHTAVLFDIGVFLLVVGFTISVIDLIAREDDRGIS